MKFLGDSAHVKVQYWYTVCKVGSVSEESFVKEAFSLNIEIFNITIEFNWRKVISFTVYFLAIKYNI